MTAVRLPPAQQRVDEMIEQVGGYWRPVAGVARLLEEIGELAEQTHAAPPDAEAIAEELADIWIISACLANQFNISLPEQDPHPPPTREIWAISEIAAEAGRVARIVNYYDGPKTPRSLDNWMPLGRAISALHSAVRTFAERCSVDLDLAIEKKISLTSNVDSRRFAPSFNPSTAAALEEFSVIRKRTPCPFATAARLWGAPGWNTHWSIARNVDCLLPYLVSFTKAATSERLDGFILSVDCIKPPDMAGLARWFASLLETLRKSDPASEAEPIDERVLRRGWQFSFNECPLFISVFSPLYRFDHPR